MEIILAFVILDLNVTRGSGTRHLCDLNKIHNPSEALLSSPVNSASFHLMSIVVSHKVKESLKQ